MLRGRTLSSEHWRHGGAKIVTAGGVCVFKDSYVQVFALMLIPKVSLKESRSLGR